MTGALFDQPERYTPPAMKGLAPWFGAKRGMASTVIGELGQHRAYWEPFCGSMAVLLSKPPEAMETVNDLHQDLVNLARVIQDAKTGPALYRRLRRAHFSQELFKESRSRCLEPITEANSETRAYDYFLTSWQGMNGVAGTERYNLGFCRRYTKNGGHTAKRFSSAVDSIPTFRRRLRNVTILSCDALELLEKIEDAEGVTIYADPPYLVKGATYLHDFTDADHERLAKALRRFVRSRVVVSYYADPRLESMFPGWTFRDCTKTKALTSQGRRGRANDTRAPEVLVINGPSMAGRLA